MFSSRIPGSIMLLGEHAVLHGGSAIACAINRYMTVTLTPRDDDKVLIDSETLGHYKADVQSLSMKKPFDFILTALKQANINTGCDIVTCCDFSDKIGLGSSAAVTIATLQCLAQWNNTSTTKKDILQKAVKVIHEVQGLGSGTDAAASLYGGVIAFNPHALRVECLQQKPAISLIYCGYKTTTSTVVNKVNTARKAHPDLYEQYFQAINQCVTQGIQYIKQENWPELGNTLLQQQTLMHALGVSDDHLDTLIKHSLRYPTILGAKISGSGLGDCLVTLGTLPKNSFPEDNAQKKRGVKQLDITIT